MMHAEASEELFFNGVIMMVNRGIIWVLLATVMVSNACGGGSSSGSEKQSTQSIAQAGDFAVSFDRPSITVAAGSVTPQVILQIKPINNFNGAVSISGQLPTGFSCFQSSCSGTSSAPGYSTSLQFSSSPSLPSATYNLVFVASSGSINHQATLSISLTSPVPIQPNRSAFVQTGDLFQIAPVFDAVHQVVYASDMQANVVHVISTHTHQLTGDIHVPSPEGIDITPDGALLYIGSDTQYLFIVDANKLVVIDRVRLPNSISTTIFPQQVATLSNGKVLLAVGCGRINPCTTQVSLELYDPGSRSFASIPLGAIPSVGVFTRSADHSSVYIGPSDNGGNVARFDVTSGTLVPRQLVFGEFVNALAVSPDNSTLAAVLDCCELDLLDTNFNVKAKKSMNEDLSALVFSSDSSRIYMDHGAQTQVFSATDLSSPGSIPSVAVFPGSLALAGWDDDQHLIGYGPYSVVFIDASIPPSVLPDQEPNYRFGIGQNSTLTPDNPSAGLSTIFNGAQFTEVPLITFAGAPATNVTLSSTTTIGLNAPALSGVHDVDVMATFPSGYSLLAPSAYSYAPRVRFADGDVSAENDSGKLTLYGYGFDFQPSQISLTVGGAPATNLQVSGAVSSSSVTPLYAISANVPPGVAGPAQVTLNTPIGTLSLPESFHYAHRDDYTLTSGASPFQMVYDGIGNRLFWTDPAASSLEVFSLTSRSIVAQVPIGIQPAGLSLTPDGSKLLVAVFGQKQLAIVDTASLKVTSFIATPFDPLLSSLDPRPIYVEATSNGKAFLLNTINGYSCLSIYEYNIANNTFTERKDAGACAATESSVAGVSTDGSRAILGTAIYTAASDAFTPLSNGTDTSPRALNADGSTIVAFRAFHAADGAREGVATAPEQIETDVDSNWIFGEKLNATGSLLYLPEKDRIRIFDVRHGTLARTLMVPDGLMTPGDCLSVEPQGRGVWVMTSRGLSHFTFDSDPLSIGELQSSSGQLNVLGSGFDPSSQVLIDGLAVKTTFVDANHLNAAISAVPPGTHQVTSQAGSGTAYTLDAAFTSQ